VFDGVEVRALCRPVKFSHTDLDKPILYFCTLSYDQKELLDIMTAITNPVLEEDFSFNKSDAKDLLQTPDKALIPVIHRRKRQRYRGRRSGCLVRIQL
jgi:hypothetical protein